MPSALEAATQTSICPYSCSRRRGTVQWLRPPCGVQPVTAGALLLRGGDGWAQGAEDGLGWWREGWDTQLKRRDGDGVPRQGLRGAFEHHAGGEVAVGSRLPAARQPVVTEVEQAAEVGGLGRGV